MKNVIFLTCWALFAHILPSAAQPDPKIAEVLQDTIVIRLQDRNQIHITGAKLPELVKYERADSLKLLFLQDLQTGFSHGSFPEFPERLHYLVSTDGRRRLKAEFTNPTEDKFDLGHEKLRLRLNLPPNHFTVYDLKTNVEIHFYLEDSSAIAQLETARIKPALDEAAQETKNLKKFVRYTVETQGDVYQGKGTKGNKADMLSIEPLFGVALIGNQLTPTIGAAAKLTLHNKYSVPRYQFGIQYFGFIISSEPGYKFRNVNPGTMYDVTFGINTASRKAKTQWVGIQAGLTDKTRNNILPKHAAKGGFFIQKGSFTYSTEFIRTDKNFRDKDGNSLYMFSVKTTF